MTASAQLRSIKPPWVHLVVLDAGEKPAPLAVPPEFTVRTIDGRRGSTKRGLLSEIARAFEFPADSGRNWDALEELLADLEWLPAKGYLLILTHADQLLKDDPADYETFIDIAKGVGKEWATAQRGESARPACAFHVCLLVTRGRVKARGDWRVPRLAI
jgi:hypothetical protein